MSIVVQLEGSIGVILKTLKGRRFKKQLTEAFGENAQARLRIEKVDEYDERIYG